MQIYTLKVAAVRSETNDTVTLAFKQPGLKKIRYKAGQYLTLIFRINGRRYIRPYSFSSAPGVDNFLEVTIKRVPGGVVSNHVCDMVKEGDVIEVMEPLGDFTLTPEAEQAPGDIVLWGAGSGITPLISIAKYLLHLNKGHHVTLVYGNRTPDAVIFKEQIATLQEQFPSTFSAWHFYTQLSVLPGYPNTIQGRIQPGRILEVIKAEKDIQHLTHYICGPAGLKESVREALSVYDIPAGKIYTEDFELVKNEKDFEDVFTQPVQLQTTGTTHEVEVVKGKSILEAALDSGLELPYSCQTGNCSVCKGRLLEGEVRQIVPRHADLQEAEYQLCCTYPLTGNVKFII
jgi:ring-1,2-phenylacetyl-CoA epoxidase subunit PaaE